MPYERLKIGSFETPIPKWTIHAVGVLITISALVWGYWWAVDHLEHGKIVISPAEKLQLTEAAKHFDEHAAQEFTAFDDPRGLLKVLVFDSDGCVATIRRSGTGPRQVQWLADASRFTAPSTIRADDASVDLSLSTPAYAQGHCLWPHGGEYKEWTDENNRKECWVPYWREYNDGCTFWVWANSCAGWYWQSDKDGNPVLNWTRCNH